jgi:hypothetical protein
MAARNVNPTNEESFVIELDLRLKIDPDRVRRLRGWLVRHIAERAVEILAQEEQVHARTKTTNRPRKAA